jgi:hypothetical protein
MFYPAHVTILIRILIQNQIIYSIDVGVDTKLNISPLSISSGLTLETSWAKLCTTLTLSPWVYSRASLKINPIFLGLLEGISYNLTLSYLDPLQSISLHFGWADVGDLLGKAVHEMAHD